jgi:hypothetical protein
MNKLPRKPKPSPEQLAEAVAALPRAQMRVADAAPVLEQTPAPVAAPAPEPEAPAPFAWTDAKRAKLVREYVNTGDLLKAQESVGCTPAEFNAELRSNDLFRATVEGARKDARTTLLLRAQSEALAGNDRLLQVFVKESDGDSDNLRHLTDDQLTQRLNGIFARIRARLEGQGWAPCQSCGALKEPT